MTIKRLVKDPAFPQIGILRKGDKKKDERKPGKNLTYFRFVTEDASAAAAFATAYGEEPRDINIMLPFRTTAENFDFWMEEWVAGGLKCRCDGETIVLHQKTDSTYSTKPKVCPGSGQCQCSEVGRLSVIIPELGRLALVTVLTTSIHDCMELNKNLTAYEAMRGDLRGIPFVLRRRPRKISKPINGKRVRMEEWLLTIETDEQWVQMQLSEFKQMALPAGATVDDSDDENTVEADYDVVDFEPPTAPHDESPEETGPPPHWSEDADNREKLEKALTKKGIALEYLFKACGVEDWADMSRFEDEGKAAFDLAVALWEKERGPQPEAA